MNILYTALFCLSLTACASEMVAGKEYRAYIEQTKPLAEAGRIKWSAYYIGAYDEARKANAPAYVLRNINKMTGYAQQLEAGKISADEFGQLRREVIADDAAEFENSQARYAEAQQRQQALGAAQMAAGVQMMQASGPAAFPQPAMLVTSGMLRGQSVSGMLRYCSYSNGVVNTISSVALCPMSAP